MLIDIIAGARPNFVKIAPIIAEIRRRKIKGEYPIEYRLIHTGQHYDRKMSADFFDQLDIPQPDYNLASGSGSQAEQTAKIMIRYEELLSDKPCDLTLVVGDVNSTMATGITAKKMNILLAHVEAGIRSFDLSMPEEINRMVTDSISDYFYTTSHIAGQNLVKAGIPTEKIQFVGNTMIDTLYSNIENLKKPAVWDQLNLQSQNYIVMTLHRPGNVDEEQKLRELVSEVIRNSKGIPVVFPIHPRTLKSFELLGLNYPNLHTIEPLSYLEFNYLVKHSKAIITDSGGITEEATVLGIPCMTLRESTERPETCDVGTNELLGVNPEMIEPALNKLFSGNWKKGSIPEKWDGKTSSRIVDHLEGLTKK